MAPPDYREPEVYSVFLDSQALRPGYAGTAFPVSEVLPVDENKSLQVRESSWIPVDSLT
jgi:hypothetical protein